MSVPTLIQYYQMGGVIPQKEWIFRLERPQTAGNLNAVLLKWYELKARVKAISDTAGNSYASAYVGDDGAIFFAFPINPAAANCVTVVFEDPVTLVPDKSRVAEYEGVAGTAVSANSPT
jgi:hypothetical protein